MCLVKLHNLPKKSKNEIKVYKALRYMSKGTYLTPFLEEPVNLGEKIKARYDWKDCPNNNQIGGEGVHAYRSINLAICKLFFSSLINNLDIKIFEAIIPPNTEYWEGEDDIASVELLITEKEIKLDEI